MAERARRYAAPPHKGQGGKAGDATKPDGAKAGHKNKSAGRKSATTAEKGKAPRSTGVVLTRIQPASVLRISILFYLSLCLALLVAGVLLWLGATSIGLVGNIEGFMDEVGFTDFRLRGRPMLFASMLAGLVLVVAGSLANYLMAVLYNLIGDVVGGIKVVLTEDHELTRK